MDNLLEHAFRGLLKEFKHSQKKNKKKKNQQQQKKKDDHAFVDQAKRAPVEPLPPPPPPAAPPVVLRGGQTAKQLGDGAAIEAPRLPVKTEEVGRATSESSAPSQAVSAVSSSSSTASTHADGAESARTESSNMKGNAKDVKDGKAQSPGNNTATGVEPTDTHLKIEDDRDPKKDDKEKRKKEKKKSKKDGKRHESKKKKSQSHKAKTNTLTQEDRQSDSNEAPNVVYPSSEKVIIETAGEPTQMHHDRANHSLSSNSEIMPSGAKNHSLNPNQGNPTTPGGSQVGSLHSDSLDTNPPLSLHAKRKVGRIQQSRLDELERFRSGYFSEVWKGFYGGSEVAIKFAKLSIESSQAMQECETDEERGPKLSHTSREAIEMIEKEAYIMASFPPHQNVVEFLGVTDEQKRGLVTRICSLGSVETLLINDNPGCIDISELTKIKIATQTAKGLDHLHSWGVIHHDVAARNILIENQENWRVRVSDFGLSEIKDSSEHVPKKKYCCPTPWLSPEAIKGERHDEKSDVFAFGVVLFELFSGKRPWVGEADESVRTKVCAGERLKFTERCPNFIRDLAYRCWKREPSDRPTMEVVKNELEDYLASRQTDVKKLHSSGVPLKPQRDYVPFG